VAGAPVAVFAISLSRRRIGLLGLASVAVILVGMASAAIPYRGYAGEGYSPLNHFISELGEVAASRYAWAFNLSLVVGAMGLGAFLVALSSWLSGRLRTAFLAFSAVAGTAGALVGVFPMDYLGTHRVVSFAFFLTGWLVAATFTIWLARTLDSDFPRWLVLPGILVSAVFVIFMADYSTYHPADPDARILTRPEVWSVPALEWAALLSLLFWFVCVGVVLLRQRSE
jgi:hypothetical membrane protein